MNRTMDSATVAPAPTGTRVDLELHLAPDVGSAASGLFRELHEPADRRHEPHLLHRPAIDVEQRRRAASTARHCARDVATLKRCRSKANPIPRGASSDVELAIETTTTGACWPWNLSTVPTGTAGGSFDRSVRTWAL